MCDFAAYAMRRYPGEMLALEFFASDRRVAGLGALDAKRRPRRRDGISNSKWWDAVSGHICYAMAKRTGDAWQLPRMRLADLTPGTMARDATAQLVLVPGVTWEVRVPVSRDELQSQRGRDTVAAALRRARRSRPAKPQGLPAGPEGGGE